MKAFNKDKELRKLKFRQNKNAYIKRVSIVLSCVILIISIMLFTFAYYNSSIEFTLIEGKVSEPSKDANIIAIYQGENKVDSVPAKGSGWYFDRAECTNDAHAVWDNDRWSLILNASSKTKCTLYFKNQPVQHYTVVSGNIYAVGSVVKIANEEFYVIGQEDSTHVKLLSKWNLNVGSNSKGTATGRQDSDVRGYVESGTTYGTVEYSSTNYWYDSTNRVLKSQYGSSYPAYVYDNNSTLYQYVDTYVTYLINQGVNVSGRLIKREELISLGCTPANSSCAAAPEWVYQTSYWSGSADSNFDVRFVYSYDYFTRDSIDGRGDIGVRPVIILEI